MRLLICTQAVDSEDKYLGFMVQWLAPFATKFEHIHVICLKQGKHTLPPNVTVHSLGKESSGNISSLWKRVVYVYRLKMYAWRLRREYDAAFVHMNQEYVLICAAMWKLLGKRIYLWRNHYAGNWLTALAVALSDKVFCTSAHSYTAQFKKTVIMPVGVDTDFFAPVPGIERVPRSILFYSRLAPSKNPHVLIEALDILAKKGIEFTATIRGTPLPEDEAYEKSLKKSVEKKGLSQVRFEPGLPHREGPAVFSAAEIYVNLGGTGMYDKMIFEAAACGALVLASSADYAELVDPQFVFITGDSSDLAQKLKALLALSGAERSSGSAQLRSIVVEKHSLRAITHSLYEHVAS